MRDSDNQSLVKLKVKMNFSACKLWTVNYIIKEEKTTIFSLTADISDSDNKNNSNNFFLSRNFAYCQTLHQFILSPFRYGGLFH